MFGDDESHDSFEEFMLSVAREVSQSLERAAQAYMDELADSLGMDPARAKALLDGAVGWLRDQAERAGGDSSMWGGGTDPEARDADPPERYDRAQRPDRPDRRNRPSPSRSERPAHAGPRPLDLPSDDQGVALAALDSGRWTVRPGSHVLVGQGGGPEPGDALDLVGELRARDWIAANGELTLSGREALSRWLGTVSHQLSR